MADQRVRASELKVGDVIRFDPFYWSLSHDWLPIASISESRKGNVIYCDPPAHEPGQTQFMRRTIRKKTIVTRRVD